MTCPRPEGKFWLSWAEMQTWECLDVFPCGVNLISVVRIDGAASLPAGLPHTLVLVSVMPRTLPSSVSGFVLHPEGSCFPWEEGCMKSWAGAVNQISGLPVKGCEGVRCSRGTFHQWSIGRHTLELWGHSVAIGNFKKALGQGHLFLELVWTPETADEHALGFFHFLSYGQWLWSRASQPQHCWHFGPGNSLLQVAILCLIGRLVAFLPSTY